MRYWADGKPEAFIEAKHLGEWLSHRRHEDQVFNYAFNQKVRFYAGLTDGNRWIFEDVAAGFSGGESRLLDVTISKELAAPVCTETPIAVASNLGIRRA